MLPDQVSNPGPLTYESGALPIALRGPAKFLTDYLMCLRAQRANSVKPTLYYDAVHNVISIVFY